MKIIKYNISTRVNHGSEAAPVWVDVATPVEMRWSEQNERIARAEAADGIFSIEDDGKEETSTPSQEERITDLEEAFALLLSGVTE